MAIEVEVKFRVPNLEEIEYQLIEWGANLDEIVIQRDHYFNHPSRDFAETDEAFRIREEGESTFLTYKGRKINKKSKTRKEIEIKISQTKEAAEMLELLGFKKVLVVSKQRRIYKLDDVAWCLDEVDSLGSFLELEKIVKNNKDIQRTLDNMFKLVAKIGLNPKENITTSYMELLLENEK